MKKALYYILLCLSVISCQKQTTTDYTIPQGQHAQGFVINNLPDYTEVIVFDPWQQGKIMQRYYLVKSDQTEVGNDGIRIRIPLQKIAFTSCTHAGFLDAIGQTESTVAACSPYLVYTPLPAAAKDLGDAMQLNQERVLLAAPDAIMISTYAQGDQSRAQIEKAGIPIIYNNEWTEHTPLARAEWIRLVAAFFDKQSLADSIFRSVEQQYNDLCALTDTITRKRTIMSGNNYRGTWYVPSGDTYMGHLFKDAGADYYYQNDSAQASIPLSIETVLTHFKNADVWVGSPARSMKELKEIDEKHTWFKAYQNNQVYNFLNRTTTLGGNDFWESGVVHPELMLQDLIYALYPALLPDYQPTYISHLQ